MEDISQYMERNYGVGVVHLMIIITHRFELAHIAKVFDQTQLKILTPKQMHQRLLIALAQLKASNTSE